MQHMDRQLKAHNTQHTSVCMMHMKPALRVQEGCCLLRNLCEGLSMLIKDHLQQLHAVTACPFVGIVIDKAFPCNCFQAVNMISLHMDVCQDGCIRLLRDGMLPCAIVRGEQSSPRCCVRHVSCRFHQQVDSVFMDDNSVVYCPCISKFIVNFLCWGPLGDGLHAACTSLSACATK